MVVVVGTKREGGWRYLGSVEPDQIERVEIERRIRAVQDWPRSELGGSEAGDYNPGQLGVVSGGLGVFSVGDGSLEHKQKQNNNNKDQNGEAESSH